MASALDNNGPRVAATWLLVVAVFFCAAELGGSMAAAEPPCGNSCPCDDATMGGGTDAPEDGAAQGLSSPEQGEPCKDACPDDCPDCGCCLRIAAPVLLRPMTSSATSCTSARLLVRIDTPAGGPCTGVFRPPRSQT